MSHQTMPAIPRVGYDTGGGRMSHVGYAQFGENIVFTALQPSYQGSTLNYAREIIKSICQKEKINPEKFRWFDLQSDKMWRRSMYLVTNGSFQYDEVILDHVSHTHHPAKCPEIAVKVFREYIGLEPLQVTGRGEPV